MSLEDELKQIHGIGPARTEEILEIVADESTVPDVVHRALERATELPAGQADLDLFEEALEAVE